MRRQVLERIEAAAELVHVETVENLGRLAQAEVARRPRARACEMPREEPLGRPRPETAQRRDRGTHLAVVEPREAVEVEVGAREAEHVLGLAAGESERDELLLAGAGDPLSSRECVGVLSALAEALDQPVADRKGREEGHLLGADRRDEALERVR